MDFSTAIAENLLRKGAVRVSIDPPFTWTSGIKSPVYCDNRKMISFVNERKLVVDGFKSLIGERGIEFDYIGGTATAAIPWAAFLAYELDLPMIYIRPEKKAHGAGKQIEGFLKEGSRVLIVEDLISTGGSSVKAAEAVREEGKSIVSDVFAIVTYEMDQAKENFEKANLRLTTLTDYSKIVDMAGLNGYIDPNDISNILEFRKDPVSWASKMGY